MYDENGSPFAMSVKDARSGTVKTYYYEKNLQGDIVGIMNEAGYKVVSYTYDAWGNPYSPVYAYYSGVSAADRDNVELNPFRYRGYYYDTETGYYYLQTRYYSPDLGRFLNADGYINANGDILGYNMFAYCGNNPVMGYDPTGECGLIGLFIAGLIIISTGINHVINKINEKKIDSEIKESYTQKEAKEEIEALLKPYLEDQTDEDILDKGLKVTFNDDDPHPSAMISYSYLVTSRYDRQKVCKILSRTEKINREYDNMSAEWLGHNICYFFRINRESTSDVNIDYVNDPRNEVIFATKVLEILGWD